MFVGVALLVLGGFFTAAMLGVMLGASNDGTFVVTGSLTLGHQSGAALAVALAVTATGLLFLGLRRLEIARWSEALSDPSDDRVPAIEQHARGRLLQLRHDQLKREVEGLELRRAIALSELHGPPEAASEEDDLLLLPEAGGTTLSRRMRSEAG